MLQKETVIPQSRTNQLRNVLCEFAYAAPLARRSQSPLGTNGRFRTDRLTRLVPVPVRFVLRNDGTIII